ncbi:MAG: tetratricopeptide repeat protein [Anaerolineae bacterium]|nr:tetratricopeptide repeat protein [Anaerolineae bacterium]
MAIISLREYVRDIQGMIENSQEYEAIEHCKHILTKFPKHLDTYRLLGQALLEANRYQEAVDLFLRVLSVNPEDFIAHIGLSVVNEAENNLDAAIWHMERAYEVRSTEAVHEELQRLFSMRDGYAPPKPYITRGALIRINIRSGLYQQALAEIQRAVQEDPQRMDLLILRARIYYMQNNLARAAETCKMVLSKLPYSYDANAMMAEILGNTGQADPYKLRLHELDPYTTYVSSSMTVDQVSDHAVGIEFLEEIAQNEFDTESNGGDSETHFVSPDDSINVDFSQIGLSDTTAFDVSDGQTKNRNETDEEEAGMSENDHEEIQDDDLIPDWMKDAGWEHGEEKSEEEQIEEINAYDGLSDELETIESIDELEETDIPEWLQSFSPPESVDLLSEKPSDEPDVDTEEETAWLDNLLDQETQSACDVVLEMDKTGNDAEEEIPLPESLSQPIFGENIDADLEWLEQITSPTNNGKIHTEEEQPAPVKGETDELGWLMPDNTAEQQSIEQDVELPQQGNFAVSQDNEPSEYIPPTEPDVISPEASSENIAAAEEEDDFDFDSALAWLEGLAAKQGADEETLSTAPESRSEEIPDWIQQHGGPESLTPKAEVAESQYDPEQEFVPEWLSDGEKEPSITAEFESSEEQVELEDAFEDIPPWLHEVKPPEHVDEIVTSDAPEVFTDDLSPVEEPDVIESSSVEEEWEAVVDELEVEEFTPQGDTHETMSTTAVLDFIKSGDDHEEDEIDQWLENLPEMDWAQDEAQRFTFTDAAPEQAVEREDRLDQGESSLNFEEESDETVQEPIGSDTPAASFIDEFFADEVSAAMDEEVEQPTEQAVEQVPPYVWEQEYSAGEGISITDNLGEDELPDWISDIPETSGIQVLPAPEKIHTPADDLDEESRVEMFEMEETRPLEKLEQKQESDVDGVAVTEPEVSSQDIAVNPVQETGFPEPEPLDFKSIQQWLAEGNFSMAHTLLREQVKSGQNLNQVIDTLLHDINHYHPIEIDSWILLGDAYFKQDDLIKALDAYNKAEDFLN